MDKSKIHEVVLVGGSTRIPKVQQLLQDYFHGKELNRSINPDEAVAYGAAVQAAILYGVNDPELNKIVLIDVAALSLGVETAGGIMTTIVPRNTNLPTKKQETFTTYEDNQTSVTIKIFEGERPLTRDNHLLGKFDLTGIPPAPRGIPKIDVSFDLNTDGILNVTAIEKNIGKEKSLTINNQRGRLSKEEIEKLIKESESFKEKDEILKKKFEAKNKLENFIYGIRSSIRDENLKSRFNEEERKKIESILNESLSWIESHEPISSSIEEYEKKHKLLEEELNPFLMKLYNKSSNESKSNDNHTQSNGNHNGPVIESVDE